MKRITLMNVVVSLTLFVSFTTITNAQQQNANWYFGIQAGLNFNDGTSAPTILTNSAMSTEGSTATVSDTTGNLLFYTDGIKIYNNTHQVMLNGTNLFGNTEINQSVTIVPDPANTDKYYMFTNRGSVMGLSGFYYSVIDMTLDNGLGGVDTSQKNIPLLQDEYAKNVTTISNPDDNTYWIIVFGYGFDSQRNDTFYSYKIDALGVNLSGQTTFTFGLPESEQNTDGQLKLSPDGQTLALVYNSQSNNEETAQSLFTFNFDITTGIISSMNDSYILNDNLSSYGVEFSPDSNLLYVSSTKGLQPRRSIGRIYQVDYQNAGTSLQIYEGEEPIYGLQAGIDGKIYSVTSTGSLGIINAPNVSGIGANYVHDAVALSPYLAAKELPQPVPFNTTVIIEDICETIKVKNPFKKKLRIQFEVEQIYTVSLFNSSGILKVFEIHDAAIDKNLVINTSSLPSGIYFLVIKTEQFETCSKTLIRK